MILSRQIGNCRGSVSAFSASSTTGRTPVHQALRLPGRRPFVAVRAGAESDPDAELEARLEKLREAKSSRKAAADAEAPKAAKSAPSAPASYDWTGEKVFYEGAPHRGDLAINLALGATLLWLPLTFAALGRGLFVNYRFTDRRFTVSTTAPWKQESTDVAYQEVKDVIAIGRGWGAWGDMVVTLRDGAKIELRSIDRWQELKAYILARRDELNPSKDLVIDLNSTAGKGFS